MCGGVISTYTSWRAIFGVQGGMTFIGMVLAFFFVPRSSQLSNLREQEKPKRPTGMDLVRVFNPSHVFRQYKYPAILLSVGVLSLY